MNSLKTFVHQIETFGTLKRENHIGNWTIKYFSIDTVTLAQVIYDGNKKPKRATFIYK